MTRASTLSYKWRSSLLLTLVTVSAAAAGLGLLRYERWTPVMRAYLTIPYNWVYPLTALLCVLAGMRSTDRVGRRTWFLLAASNAVFFVTAAIYWIPQLLGRAPWATPSDILAGGHQLLVAAAIVGMVSPKRGGEERLKFVLDIGIALGAGVLIALQTWLGMLPVDPSIFILPASQGYLAMSVAASSVALVAVLYLFVRLRALPAGWPLRLAIVALVPPMLMDFLVAFAPAPWAASPAPVSIVCTWVLALGAFLQIRKPVRLQPVAHVGSDRASRLVPFVSLAAVELVLVFRALSAEGPAARVLLLGTGLLLALVVVRQIVALRENSALIRARLKEQDRYALLVRNSSDAAILVSPEGVIRSEVPALARVLGAMSRSFEGESIFGFLEATDRTRLRTYFSELAPGHTARPILVRLAGSPEEERYVEVVAADHRLDPLVGDIVLNLRDASERVGLEAQLREAHKMEGIGRLAGGIAHDFNNLLTAILGNCELIEMEPKGSDAIKEEVGEVRRAAERAADLTRQLLQFARREMVSPQVLDIQEALWATERLLRRVLSEHIALSITCRGGPLRIKADATQLHQVVLNLVVNARDAMPDGGRLTISGAPREVSAHGSGSVKGLPGGSYVELRVSDTGLGMPPDVLRRIFEPFFTTKSVGAGTGLGLATTYGIVRQLGGSIVAESRVGEGSVFTLLLPTTEEEAESADEPSFPADARGRGTVLLAEDEPAVRALAARALVERGFEVLLAVDGEDALRVVESYGGSIEYVVSDLVMPRMGGVALANALRELGHCPRVLFMTGYTDVDIAALSDGADAEGVLLKPFAPSALLGELDQLGWTRETANDGYETARATSSRSP